AGDGDRRIDSDLAALNLVQKWIANGPACVAGPFRLMCEKKQKREKVMKTQVLTLTLATALLAAGGCTNKAAENRTNAQTPEAQKVAGTKTMAAGLAQDGKFMAAAKAAGLDQTLAGAGPYTVLVPDDAAFDKAPSGTLDSKPENRGQLTGIITNLFLQGTVMAADIEKAIDTGKGKALLATM